MSTLRVIKPAEQPRGTVIYVHGIIGDARDTWTAADGTFWPDWIAEDFPELSIFALEYPTSIFRINDRNMAIETGAIDIYQNLVSRINELKPPIYFICHSLGGLIVKEVIRHASEKRKDARSERFINSIGGIAYVATPHSGSSAARILTAAVGMFGSLLAIILPLVGRKVVEPSRILKELGDDNPHLLSLKHWHQHWSSPTIRQVAFYEDLPTSGVVVVGRGDADPGSQSIDLIGVAADHISICKPTNKNETFYQRIKSDLTEVIAAFKSKKPDALDLVLPTLLAPSEHRGLEGRSVTFKQILEPRHRAVPFVVADEAAGLSTSGPMSSGAAFDVLASWCGTKGGIDARGILVMGPMGVGKSRLLVEFMKHMEAQRWITGFLQSQLDKEAKAAWKNFLLGMNDITAPGIVVAFDPAEGRVDDVVWFAGLMLEYAKRNDRIPLRLILCARAQGRWWEIARENEAVVELFFSDDDVVDQIELSAIAGQHALTLLKEAVAVYGAMDQKADKAVAALVALRRFNDNPEELFERDSQTPLAILVQALLRAENQGLDPASWKANALMNDLTSTEYRKWRDILAVEPNTIYDELLETKRVVGSIIAVGGMEDYLRILELASKVVYGPNAEELAGQAVRLLAIAGGYDGTVSPEVFADHIVGGVAEKPWVERITAWVWQQPDDEIRSLKLFETLNRATIERHHGAQSKQAEDSLRHIFRLWQKGAIVYDRFLFDIVTAAMCSSGKLNDILEAELMPETLSFFRVNPLTSTQLIAGQKVVAKRDLIIAEYEQSMKTRPPRSSSEEKFRYLVPHVAFALADDRKDNADRMTRCGMELCTKLEKEDSEFYVPPCAATMGGLGGDYARYGHSRDAVQLREAQIARLRK